VIRPRRSFWWNTHRETTRLASSRTPSTTGFIDTDPATAGTQNYGFPDGQFDVVLQAFDGATLVARNQVVVHANNDFII
jgi:hypothetical protein